MFCLDGSQVDVSKVDGGGGGGGEHDGHRHQRGSRASGHGGGKHRCRADFLSWPSAECPFLGNSKKGVSFLFAEKFKACCRGSNMIT